jgi:hypothetical protein
MKCAAPLKKENGGGTGLFWPVPLPLPSSLRRLNVKLRNYCSSFNTSCWTLLAWASAEMPVWLRISYLDRFEVAAP